MKKAGIILGIIALIASGCNLVPRNNIVGVETSEISNDSVISQIPFMNVVEKDAVWIYENSNTVVFRKFYPDTLIMDFSYMPFEVRESYKVNGLKLLFGYYRPSDRGEKSPYDSETDWGKRLVCFNEKNEIVFRSHGELDSWIFRPVFFISDDKKQIVILCQLGAEHYWGATVFLIENNKIYHIGLLDIEPHSEEDYELLIPVTSVTNIKRINNTLEFTFNEKSIENVRYTYVAGELNRRPR